MDWWIYIERTLSLVVALFWPVLLELSDFCQLATGCIYFWILWIKAAESDCICNFVVAIPLQFSLLVLRNVL